MRVIVCGGRNYYHVERVYDALDEIHDLTPIHLLMEGGAAGADRIAADWAIKRGVNYMTFKAYWLKEGLSAGPKRNTRMVNVGAGLVIAFPGGDGTADLIRKAKAKKIPVKRVGW